MDRTQLWLVEHPYMCRRQLARMSESEIVGLAQNGVRTAYDHLLETYDHKVRHWARELACAALDTEDLEQEGRIGFDKAIRCHDLGQDSFAAFAKFCVNAEVVDAIRRATKDTRAADAFISHTERVYAPSVCPSHIAARMAETLATISCISLSELSRLERDALDHHTLGRTTKEIAEILGKSPKSICNALQRAKRKLSSAFKS